MFNTISISELQKSPKSAIKHSNPFTFVLSHNQKQGGIANKHFVEFLEEEGILSIFEDWQIRRNKKAHKAFTEGEKILNSGDFSGCVGLDDL